MTLQAVLIVVGAFVLALGLGALQHRAYQHAVNALAAQEHRPGVVLVTGRAKGLLRGAVVVLVVDGSRRAVVRAQVMEGASTFARFREAPDLLGPVASTAERARSAARRKAVEDALARYRRLSGQASKPVRVR
jgi:glucitol operon activator protein